jgi:3-dehydrosphinganine reductase
LITGGSRGIGLEIARCLVRRGQPTALFARDADTLTEAVADLRRCAPTDELAIEGYPCDVSDRAALERSVAAACRDLGPPTYAIAAAGMAVPGLFIDQTPDIHDRHMAVNFGGSRDFVRALLPEMPSGGRIGLISSAAAYLAIYGYSAYAPSKYALRALAEVLRLELAPLGIAVTHIAPADTDTAQLATEARTKPAATREITAAGGLWPAETVAARAVTALDRGKAEAPIGMQTAALARLSALGLPLLRGWQSRVVRRHVGR